jgi:glucose/arabinose dehydrogenase
VRTNRLCVETLEDRTTPATLLDGFGLSLFAGNLTLPTALQEAPDGRLFVTEKGGSIRVVQSDGTLLAAPALTINVETKSERGLLGITIDAEFATNHFVYVYYTVPPATLAGNANNRISRFTMVGNTINPNTEFVLEDLDPTPNSHHNGGALHFGIDGKLYVAVGDNTSPGSAQSLTSHFGKILRFNADGTIPSDNPVIIEGFFDSGLTARMPSRKSTTSPPGGTTAGRRPKGLSTLGNFPTSLHRRSVTRTGAARTPASRLRVGRSTTRRRRVSHRSTWAIISTPTT